MGMTYHLGWLPDMPDRRDFTLEHQSIKPAMARIKLDNINNVSIPSKVDLRTWCPPIEDQQSIGACTAHAGVGLIEYFEKRSFGKHIDASRLFLYKVTRNLLNWKGDTGAFLRTTIGAMALFGVPPEKYWPYNITQYDVEPPAFCYSFAQSYKAIYYARLDPPGIKKDMLLKTIKALLAAGVPSMFGFTVYNSISQARTNGEIPYPSETDSTMGGHAIDAVGYDDEKSILNTATNAKGTKGALLIRNSWGENWGEKGYGWLPYDYVLNGLAVDWWILLKNDWINTGIFSL